jgi:hypothetical protein
MAEIMAIFSSIFNQRNAMAQRLTPSSMPVMPKRPRGRPRKDGRAREAQEARPVSDSACLAYVERGRRAYLEAMRRKQDYQSAWRVYSQLVKDAKKLGATELAQTLEALRRDPSSPK